MSCPEEAQAVVYVVSHSLENNYVGSRGTLFRKVIQSSCLFSSHIYTICGSLDVGMMVGSEELLGSQDGNMY